MYTTVVRSETGRSELRSYITPDEWVARLPVIAAEVESLLDYHPEIRVYGKVCHQQRSVGFFSNDTKGYYYSHKLTASKPMTASLCELLSFINTYFGAEFNSILVNKYESGEEYISAHADDEAGLDQSVGVVCLSVGATRNLRIRDKATKKIVANVPTKGDEMLQMWGDFQSKYTHEVTKEASVRGSRISFTFRKIVDK